jgi:hypothetical protein
MTATAMTDTVMMDTKTLKCGERALFAPHAYADANGVLTLNSQKTTWNTTREIKMLGARAMRVIQPIPKRRAS